MKPPGLSATPHGAAIPALRWLRLEGAMLFGLAIVLYAIHGAGWWLFAVLFLAPDLSMAGYLAGPRVGAVAYNLFHAYAVPAVVAAVALFAAHGLLLTISLVWFAHIGFDRMLGYGLKLSGGFFDTHLGPIGAARKRAS